MDLVVSKTKTKTAAKRVALMCDIPGLWWGATKFKSGRVDYSKLRREVAGDNRHIQMSTAWLADREGLDKFMSALRHSGYDTRVVPRGASIDQLITNAALDAIATCDIVAIAASSGRYTELGDQLRAAGKELEIWAFPVQCMLDEMNGKADRWNHLGDQVLLAS
jgi:hypothetical protein